METPIWYLVSDSDNIEKTFAHRDQVYGTIEKK